jgi:hypothetical protein
VGETFSPVKFMGAIGNLWGPLEIYRGHWNFMGAIGIINQSIEEIKKRIPDCKINVI